MQEHKGFNAAVCNLFRNVCASFPEDTYLQNTYDVLSSKYKQEPGTSDIYTMLSPGLEQVQALVQASRFDEVMERSDSVALVHRLRGTAYYEQFSTEDRKAFWKDGHYVCLQNSLVNSGVYSKLGNSGLLDPSTFRKKDGTGGVDTMQMVRHLFQNETIMQKSMELMESGSFSQMLSGVEPVLRNMTMPEYVTGRGLEEEEDDVGEGDTTGGEGGEEPNGLESCGLSSSFEQCNIRKKQNKKKKKKKKKSPTNGIAQLLNKVNDMKKDLSEMDEVELKRDTAELRAQLEKSGQKMTLQSVFQAATENGEGALPDLEGMVKDITSSLGSMGSTSSTGSVPDMGKLFSQLGQHMPPEAAGLMGMLQSQLGQTKH